VVTCPGCDSRHQDWQFLVEKAVELKIVPPSAILTGPVSAIIGFLIRV
jgi:hypothetical protein